MTTFTASLGFWEGTPLDPSIKGAWATPLNTNFSLIESALVGTAVISLTGQASPFTISKANGAADNFREVTQQFTGVLTGTMIVIVPNVPKYGYFRNSTTGGFSITVNAGAGTAVSIPPDGQWHFYWIDGASNVTLPQVVFGPPASPGPINGTTGTFSDLITPNSVKGVKGTAVGDDAQVGSVGEIISGTVVPPGTVLTTGISQSIVGITLTPGDWDVWAGIQITPAPATTIFTVAASISLTSNTLGGLLDATAFLSATFVSGGTIVLPVGMTRISVAFSTPVFLVSLCNFSGGTASAGAKITARRAR